jgi:hypothetical protein
MLGRPIEVVVSGENVIQICATQLGFPANQYPDKVRLRDENGTPRWFKFQKVDQDRSMHYASEPSGFTMIVFADWEKH